MSALPSVESASAAAVTTQVPGLEDLLRRLEAVSAGTGDERRDTRERILNAAIELFAVEGFQAASMRRLATAVGISAPGLYSHFPSKEIILAASMARAMHAFLTAVACPPDPGTAADRLEGLLRRHIRFQIQNRPLVQASDSLLNSEAVLKHVPDHARRLLRDAQRIYFSHIRAIVEECAAPNRGVDPSVDAFAVLTLCDQVTSWYRNGGRLTEPEIENQYWILVQGMLGMRAGQ